MLVQALKDPKDTVIVLGGDTHAIVADRKHPLIPLFFNVDAHLRWIGAAEFDGIVYEVME